MTGTAGYVQNAAAWLDRSALNKPNSGFDGIICDLAKVAGHPN
jgi:hypothetical protein